MSIGRFESAETYRDKPFLSSKSIGEPVYEHRYEVKTMMDRHERNNALLSQMHNNDAYNNYHKESNSRLEKRRSTY